ncbi:hypothetical protein C8R44DRAFT_664842 [Mycena epipterygia]|nr:hypothetical protein C8R44DRAFT_664840 [Mycena epipterygia]KAJ7132432.1 hypothetical protein C8R44DRAFT_664842 [Mycena epipterygia]
MTSSMELTAFVVTFVVLGISLLQFIQQYMATSILRSKIGRAVIGVWADANKRRGFDFSEYKIRVTYLEPTLTWERVEECFERQNRDESAILSQLLDRYSIGSSVGVRKMIAQGTKFVKPLELVLRPKGDRETQNTVPFDSLPPADRRLVRKYEQLIRDRDQPRRMPCTATWSNMMAALVGNPLDLTHGLSSYRDADSIASTLDNPTMHIHFSDLVACGTVLDMEVMSVDLHKPKLQMSGRHCNITTQELSGVGVIARYSCEPNHLHLLEFCKADEIHALVMMAKGFVKIGDFRANMTAWGYNSVDAVFEAIITRAETEDWSQNGLTTDAVRKRLEGDTDIQWGGKWSAPATTRVGFLLTACGNPAVANSFPHSLLTEWPDSARHLVSRTAWNLINQGVGFIESPPHLCASLNSKRVVQNHYKLTKKGGAESGGVRGWSMGTGAEFVRQVSDCWIVAGQTEQVPILAELHKLIEEGHLSVEWGKGYNANLNRNSKEFKAQADNLCWLQCMMLDTWIARQIDLLILKDADEAAVPVDVATANKCAAMAVSDTDHAKGRTTGWKKSRCKFTRYYLARLADGISWEDGRVGASCMSPNGGIGAAGWDGMPVGKPEDWATLDAVLSLRAVLMATRFELMYNTDVFLELQRFDPMIQMA